MEPQQSDLYKQYVTNLGWSVENLDGVYIFLKHIPLMGVLAKIHRPQRLPNINKLIRFLQKRRVKTIAVEPLAKQNEGNFHTWIQQLSKVVRINKSPYLPTKTHVIDLTPSEEDIFAHFSEAKRRAVRKALKSEILVSESITIQDLIRVKNKSAGLFGFITTQGLDHLWEAFSPQHAAILLAKHKEEIVGGVLLLFWEKTAYYWIAGATGKGKKLAAPTLLVWEALKLAKKRGNTLFDFVGVWDERIPTQNSAWSGFTKFKEGFGGKPRYYPVYQP